MSEKKIIKIKTNSDTEAVDKKEAHEKPLPENVQDLKDEKQTAEEVDCIVSCANV